jgi:hypothetical protein
MKIVRPSQSTADAIPQLQPAFAEIVSDCFPILHFRSDEIRILDSVRPRDLIRVYDEAGKVIETHEHTSEFKEP